MITILSTLGAVLVTFVIAHVIAALFRWVRSARGGWELIAVEEEINGDELGSPGRVRGRTWVRKGAGWPASWWWKRGALNAERDDEAIVTNGTTRSWWSTWVERRREPGQEEPNESTPILR